MKPADQQKYFTRAYKTGTDVWTHIPYAEKGGTLFSKLAKGALVLDLGSGRGTWAFHLGKLGYKVIGLDYVKEMVEKCNDEVKQSALQGKVAFMEGVASDIPLSDASFDAVTDFGLLQHLPEQQWQEYKKEMTRVLKPGGYYLNVSLSRETRQFFSWTPKASPDGCFEKDDLFYKFFTAEEMGKLFSERFNLVSQTIDTIKARDSVKYLVSLFQKTR